MAGRAPAANRPAVSAVGAGLPPGHVQFESRLPPRLALIAAIALYTTLPDRVIPGPRYIVPALETAMLVVLSAVAPRRHHSHLPHVRVVATVLVGMITVTNLITLWLLIHELLHGGAGSGRELITAAIQIWLTNVIAFGLWYWELDRGGPSVRTRPPEEQPPPDFLFPQMSTPKAAAPGWRPLFIDYLYVSFTNGTAFSPTDTMPLSATAKLLMMGQSAASLITVALVAARAVNILS